MDIRGQWFNELTSRMVIDVHGNTITGKYHTGVGEAEGEYELVGWISTPNDNNGTIAFVVAWQNGIQDTDAVTAWSGEGRDIDGTQYITATWLITKETLPNDDWRSTIIGKDYFTRTPQDGKDFKRLSLFRQPSHPFPPATL
jgi:avidin family protein